MARKPGSTSPMAERFHGTRRAHRDETAEDYAEAILNLVEREGVCRVRDLSGMMGVSHVTVTRIVSRLQKLGLVETEPYRPIGLTARGLRVARAARRRHGVVLGFLLSIGVPPRQAEIDAEGIEHHVSGATIRALRRLAMSATRAGARPIAGSGRRTDG